MAQLHASCVSISGQGVLLLGPSGSGKSDLALRLIEEGAQLVADDQVMIDFKNGTAYANPPERIAGLIEARGVGLLSLLYAQNVPLAAAVQLAAREQVERLPEPAFFDCAGASLPLLFLHAFDLSACLKIRYFVKGLP